ncbi:hypothetical protein CEP54_004353 [Fusarium duplospermum]|uniref:Uncharacterized protein n=1 Tax=Fusarium duplospermum TaxID=1325734 RepID=A0A428QJ00_9HYPO|nr:hypothetical protein CEP54_004353 [Fusarium duplospermum]
MILASLVSFRATPLGRPIDYLHLHAHYAHILIVQARPQTVPFCFGSQVHLVSFLVALELSRPLSLSRKPILSLVGLFSLLSWPVLSSACFRSSFSISDHAWSTAFRKGCARVCARARASMGLRCCVLVAGCSIMACHDHRDPWRPRDGLWAVKQQDLSLG